MNAESVKRKRLAGEYSDAAALPQGYSYTASPAQDGRSKCKGCRTQIQIGETRIGRLTKARQQGTAGDARQLAWYGTECGCIGHKDLKDMYSTRQVFGFSALPKDEQAELEECEEQITPDAATIGSSSDGTTGPTTDEELENAVMSILASSGPADAFFILADARCAGADAQKLDRTLQALKDAYLCYETGNGCFAIM